MVITGGYSIRFPFVSSEATCSSVFSDLKVPNPGTAIESSSEPHSLNTLHNPSTRVLTSVVSRLSNLPSFVINALLSTYQSNKMSRIAYRGRCLTSMKILPIYSPTMPIAMRIRLPKNHTESIREAQPASSVSEHRIEIIT